MVYKCKARKGKKTNETNNKQSKKYKNLLENDEQDVNVRASIENGENNNVKHD